MSRVALVFIVWIMGYSSAFSAEPFTRLALSLTPAGGSEVTLNFDGKLYGTKYEFSRMDKHLSSLLPEEQFVIKIVAVNTAGDRDELLSLWHPAEQARMKTAIADEEIYQKNLSLYANILRSRMIAMIRHGGFVIAYVEHELRGSGPYVKIYPLREVDGKLFMSNGMSGDFFYEQFAYPLAKYLRAQVN